MKVFLLGCLLSCLAFSFSSDAQEFGQALPTLIRANEQFGRKLLWAVDSNASDRNLVVSPLSLTLALAALRSHDHGPTRKEMDEVFGWGKFPELNVPARMLLAAFDRELLRTEHKPKSNPFTVPPEGAWIKNDLIYRRAKTPTNTFSERFVTDAKTYFGIQFNSTSGKPTR